ncbi:hypothetical protein ADUPG1_004520, partial [Aduncisulcus paluster]
MILAQKLLPDKSTAVKSLFKLYSGFVSSSESSDLINDAFTTTSSSSTASSSVSSDSSVVSSVKSSPASAGFTGFSSSLEKC